MRIQILLGLALAVPLLAQPVMADEHHDRWRHEGRYEGRQDYWRGDIHSFHERDFGRWRAGNWHHGRHDGRLGWWWIVGGLWYFYPTPVYPYPDPYQPPVVMVERPQALVPAPEPLPPPEAAAPQYWYYCEKPQGYYPYVSRCGTAWRKVPAGAPPDAPR